MTCGSLEPWPMGSMRQRRGQNLAMPSYSSPLPDPHAPAPSDTLATWALGSYIHPMTSARRLHYSYDEYLTLLDVSGVKLEYCDGEIYAMAGGTPAHADLGASITRLLGNHLLGRCRISSSDLKVHIEASGLSTFPDATVVCGERRVSALDRHAVVNPTILVEVTSKSTEDYDRGEKLSHYKQCPSVSLVLIISHRRAQVTLHERTSSGWVVHEHRAGEVVEATSPAFSFSVDELYSGIQLDGE